MRVGIITFINTINFGASLQAYALQEVLYEFGIEAEVIQYINKQIEEKEKNTGNKKNIKSIIRSIVMGQGLKKKTLAFEMYEKEHIKKGKALTDNSRDEINNYYDLFITGSDQVWNMSITNKDWTYMLDFVDDNRKKISYAPSFGNSIFPESAKGDTGKYLRQFNSLSVREESGKRLISQICNREATVVVDPTLLLNKDKWEERISFTPKLKNYILVYFPHNKKMVFDFVDKLKKKTGLPVVYLSISPRIQPGVKTIYDASPDEFLGWIKNADYVVTGSFHGTAFSLNFEKQFFYEPSGEGSRIDNLVKLCGAEERSILEVDVLESVIDYNMVRVKLDEERKKSLNWLKESVSVEEK